MRNMKSGWMTTEFFLVCLLFAVVLLNGPLNMGLDASELIATAIGVAGYGGARGLAKLRE